jgi:hypothetical protein
MQQDQEKRQLRLQVGRLRRQIDRDLHAIGAESRVLASWRTYVRRYPIPSVLAALGTGLVLSMGLRRGGLAHWLGKRLVRESVAVMKAGLWRELGRFWTEIRRSVGWVERSEPHQQHSSERTGTSHEQG